MESDKMNTHIKRCKNMFLFCATCKNVCNCPWKRKRLKYMSAFRFALGVTSNVVRFLLDSCFSILRNF